MLTCFKNVQRLTKRWYYGTWISPVFLDVHVNCMMIFSVFYRSSTWSCSADTMDGSTRSNTWMSTRFGISHTDWSAPCTPTDWTTGGFVSLLTCLHCKLRCSVVERKRPSSIVDVVGRESHGKMWICEQCDWRCSVLLPPLMSVCIGLVARTC